MRVWVKEQPGCRSTWRNSIVICAGGQTKVVCGQPRFDNMQHSTLFLSLMCVLAIRRISHRSIQSSFIVAIFLFYRPYFEKYCMALKLIPVPRSDITTRMYLSSLLFLCLSHIHGESSVTEQIRQKTGMHTKSIFSLFWVKTEGECLFLHWI